MPGRPKFPSLIPTCQFDTMPTYSEKVMYKSCFVAIATAVCLYASPVSAQGPYPFGDEPYRLNWYPDPEIAAGCWKWNWQLYQWQDRCPVYVNPKAYMFSRSSRAVLRTKG